MPDEPNLDRFSRPLWRERPIRKPSEEEMEDYAYERRLEQLEARMEERRRVAADPYYPPAWAEQENLESEDE